MQTAPPCAEPSIATVLDSLDAAFAAASQAVIAPATTSEANDLIRRVERIGRQADSMRIDVVTAVDDGSLHVGDGHKRPEIMVGHTGHLSEREAKRRARASRALRDLPEVAAGFREGRIGPCQVNRIALVHANPRVVQRFIAMDAQIAVLAARLPYEELDRRLTNWVRVADEDGTADRARRRHENRRARFTQEYDGGWELLAGFGSVDGATNRAILRAYAEAEFAKDWAEAKDTYGDATTVEHLARTHDQRDADALTRIFAIAADHWGSAAGGSCIDVNVVVDQETLERHLLRNAGIAVAPRDDDALDLGPVPDDPDDPDDPQPETEPAPVSPPAGTARWADRPRCETLDGHPLDPSEIAAHALVGRLRRVVYDARGVVIDLSEVGSLFTGSAKLAVQLERSRCYWPGCTEPLSRCQIDHLQPRRSGGRTNPGNGAPLCGRHNRHKELGYTVRRDERGRIHVHRPDGSLLEGWC